jgi:hypothetical protein
MWVRKSASQEELERLVILDCLVSHLDNITASLLYLLLQKNGFKSRIKLFTNVLKQDPFSELDGQFEISQKISFRRFEHIEACFYSLAHILDEFVGLGLRIDHEWPSS